VRPRLHPMNRGFLSELAHIGCRECRLDKSRAFLEEKTLQPLQNPFGPKVTYVAGTFCYPCLRNGHNLGMVGAIGFEPTTPCAQGRCEEARAAPDGHPKQSQPVIEILKMWALVWITRAGEQVTRHTERERPLEGFCAQRRPSVPGQLVGRSQYEAGVEFYIGDLHIVCPNSTSDAAIRRLMRP
jgi:hypothetical protein